MVDGGLGLPSLVGHRRDVGGTVPGKQVAHLLSEIILGWGTRKGEAKCVRPRSDQDYRPRQPLKICQRDT